MAWLRTLESSALELYVSQCYISDKELTMILLLSENIGAVEKALEGFASSLLSSETLVRKASYTLDGNEHHEKKLNGNQLRDDLKLSRLRNNTLLHFSVVLMLSYRI
jgi:hypothetical protein